MKIILVNKFYYRRGGDCIYTLNLENLLKKNGHEVAIFAMDYPENLDTPWKKYFPSEVKFKPGIGMLEAFIRPFGSKEVINKFNSLLNEFKPDIVHLNNIHSQISPIVADIAHKKNIKVIWTIHDCKLVCPRYDCEREGKRCEECFQNIHKCVEYKCMKGSKIASLLAYYEIKKWNNSILQNITDTFIAPSQYMKDTLVRGHFQESKIIKISNFIDLKKVQTTDFKKDKHYCYVGRLSKEKGVQTLLKAAKDLPYTLFLIGGGPLEEKLRKEYNTYSQIKFLGQQEWIKFRNIIDTALFNVLPSECAENNPLSVIEAQCLGTPVLGAEIGGIPELIDYGINGMTFESRNVEDLKNKIEIMMNSSFNYQEIAIKAQEKYNADNYYKQLMEIYNIKL